MLLMGGAGGLVILGRRPLEGLRPVGSSVHQGALDTVDDGGDVVARERLSGLERVGDREDGGAVLPEQPLGSLVQLSEAGLDPVPERSLEQVLLLLLALSGLPAATDPHAVRDAVRRDGGSHAPVPLHQGHELGRGLQVAGDAR
jgi:hypothetical protein